MSLHTGHYGRSSTDGLLFKKIDLETVTRIPITDQTGDVVKGLAVICVDLFLFGLLEDACGT